MQKEWKQLEEREGIILYFAPNTKQFRVYAPKQDFDKEYDDYSKVKAVMTRLINEKLGIKPEKGKEPVPVIVKEYDKPHFFGMATSTQQTRWGSPKIRVTDSSKNNKGYDDSEVFADTTENRSLLDQIVEKNRKIADLQNEKGELKKQLEKFDATKVDEL